MDDVLLCVFVIFVFGSFILYQLVGRVVVVSGAICFCYGVGFCSCVFGLGTFEKVFDCPLRQVGNVCFNGNCLKIFVLDWITCDW